MDMKNIGNWHPNLRPNDFGGYRPGLQPLIYGEDMNRLVNYRNMKDFCEKLLQDQLFQAVVLAPVAELDSPPQNNFDLEDHKDRDYFVMLYDPACYHWPMQLKMLRKLSLLLANETISVINNHQ
ncbi:uncharacterized protein [Drosophila pseudoobscura]|uniref:Uncharacterized protein n=1 Tax=Drosophila pseudoobscura pseudoobscura TaxID=46245 RepID=A0A6I8VPI1_DROPS|nr:uncharacterized protein LOC117183225 [Drosophila pseudoobscura]